MNARIESTRLLLSASPRGWLQAIGLAALWLAGVSALAPHVPVPPLLAYAVAFASVSASALAAAATAPSRSKVLWLGLGGALGLLVLHRLGVADLAGAIAVLCCLLMVGSAVGNGVGARIEHPGHLLFVVPVSALADVVSVHHPQGVSAQILADEAALSVLALPFALLGTDLIAPVLGLGDVVFLALYVAVARAHALSLFRTLAALALALLVTALVVVATEAAVPALPFLGVAMLAVHPEARRPRKQDRRAGVVGLGLIAAAAVWLLFFRS